jgi:hypothetical protein
MGAPLLCALFRGVTLSNGAPIPTLPHKGEGLKTAAYPNFSSINATVPSSTNKAPTTASRSLPVNGEAGGAQKKEYRFPTCGEAPRSGGGVSSQEGVSRPSPCPNHTHSPSSGTQFCFMCAIRTMSKSWVDTR